MWVESERNGDSFNEIFDLRTAQVKRYLMIFNVEEGP